MKKKGIRAAAFLAAVWLGLSLAAWFHAPQAVSEAERRKLAQMPVLSGASVQSGDFMTAFESYTLDQFPMRETFRRLKALFLYHVLRQGDSHGIYVAQGYAAQLEYPLNQASVSNAVDKFSQIYETYLKDSQVFLSIVPDKGYYLAAENGYPAMDYPALFAQVQAGMPWAAYVDITGCLELEDYYRTDTHWRQERLLPVAETLCAALGAEPPGVFTPAAVERPFYGVYYGQAALPMEPDTMYTMESAGLADCQVYHGDTGGTTEVYDLEKLDSPDLYDVYLSGAAPLLTIENPNAASDRELIVFRDSFGSSLVPLLLQGYKTVTLVDIRYIATEYLGDYLDFHGQQVLFLYSTLVLNNSATLK